MRHLNLGLLGALLTKQLEPTDENYLGEGIRLEPTDEKIKDTQYYHLYKDGKKISNELFRKRSLFRYGYCVLLHYSEERNRPWGTSVIINTEGKIVLAQENMLDYLYHIKGCIATAGEKYFNLKTGEVIVKGNATIESENFLFVENSYNKEFEEGVYKIEYSTGEFEIIK